MAGAEQPDLVARVKVWGERCPFARLRLGAEPLRIGPVGVRPGRAQGQALDDALDAPVPPVVEQVGGPVVAARSLRLGEVSLLRPRRDRAARGLAGIRSAAPPPEKAAGSSHACREPKPASVGSGLPPP